MHAKVTLLAPDNVRGEIHGSQTGQNYTIDPEGRVVVDAPDSGPLLMHGGFTHVPRSHSANDGRRGPESTAPRSTIEGATALREEDRGAGRREYQGDDAQENHDHGDALAPHGAPVKGTGSADGRASADAEVDASRRAGMDPDHRSTQADTGGMDTVKQAEADQAAAREPSDHHDGTYRENFKDHAGQEDRDPPPTLRGKTKGEVDAGGKSA